MTQLKVGILVALGLALSLWGGTAQASSTCTDSAPGTEVDLTINNLGGNGIVFDFCINGDQLTYEGETGTPPSGGTFVRFDKIGDDTTGPPLTLTGFSDPGSIQTWAACSGKDDSEDGFGKYPSFICGSTAHDPSTPVGATWTFNGTLTDTLAGHVVFTGCTGYASTSPSANGSTTSTSEGVGGACGGTSVPEPSSIGLLGSGLFGIAGLFFCRRLVPNSSTSV